MPCSRQARAIRLYPRLYLQALPLCLLDTYGFGTGLPAAVTSGAQCMVSSQDSLPRKTLGEENDEEHEAGMRMPVPLRVLRVNACASGHSEA